MHRFESSQKLVNQGGLADSGLASDYHYLAMAAGSPLPRLHEPRHLFVASHEK